MREVIKYIDDFESIKTERLLIRKLKLTDSQDFYEMMSGDGVKRFLNDMKDTDHVKKFIDKQIQNKKASFAIILGRKLIGNFVFKYDENNNSAEISYVMNENYWGQGYITEVCNEFLNILFCDIGVDMIHGDCYLENKASARVMEKLNMKYINITKRKIHYGCEDKYVDMANYAILKTEYKSNKS